jgi:hypothetical protein
MNGLIWEDGGFWVFVALTLFGGGVTAMAAGRAVAQTWRPPMQVVLYMVILAFAVRFLHYALFEGYFISLENFAPGMHYLAVTFVILVGIGLLGYRMQRAAQMARQYSWLSAGRA